MSDVLACGLRELGRRLRAGETTPGALAEEALDRLERDGRRLNAVAALTIDRAMAEADRVGRELRAGIDRGPLHGIPYGAKDLCATALHDATLIWISSTAFPEPLFAAACRHLDATALRMRLLATTTALPAPWDRVFEAVGTLHLATSWSPRTRVFVSRRRVRGDVASRGADS